MLFIVSMLVLVIVRFMGPSGEGEWFPPTLKSVISAVSFAGHVKLNWLVTYFFADEHMSYLQ